jgi:ATP/maltotriose-dependent transcriptional regulator MalT
MSHQAAAFHEVRLNLWHVDTPAARALLVGLSSRPGTLQYYRGVVVPSLAALAAAIDGRAHRASFLAGSALHAVASSGRVGASDDCDARLARALAHVDLGQVAQGHADAAQLEQTATAIQHVPYQVLAATTRARAAAVAQDVPAAEEHLERARHVVRVHAAGRELAQTVALAQVDVAFLCGERTSARRALAHLPPGRTRDRLAIRVLGMGGAVNDAEVVRQIQLVRPETPREVVDARMLMAVLTAPSRPMEAEMHLREAAAVATEAGLLTALRGRADVVQALAERLARQPGESAIAALVDAQVDATETVPPAVPPLSPGERDLLVRLARRPGNRELAEELGISTNTLKTRLRRLYGKLGVHDRDAALRVAGPRG